MSTAPTPRYDAVSQTLHWVTAIAVLAAFILGPGGFGRMLHNGIDPGAQSDVVWHESLGMLISILCNHQYPLHKYLLLHRLLIRQVPLE